MADFLYWRVSVFTTGDINNYLRINRLKLLDEGSVVVSDTPADESYSPSFADSVWDDDTASYWEGSAYTSLTFDNPMRATVELLAAADVAYLQAEATTDAASDAQYGFALESSPDNTLWQLRGFWQPGQFGFKRGQLFTLVVQGGPAYRAPDRGDLVGNGGIFGIVTEDGVVKPGTNVYLYERVTFNKYRQAISNEIGGYEFKGLAEFRDWLVMAVDPDGTTPKNAIVHDRIRPISLLSGTAQDHAFVVTRQAEPDLACLFLPQSNQWARGYNCDNFYHAWRVAEAARAQPGNVVDDNPDVYYWAPGDASAGSSRNGVGLEMSASFEAVPGLSQVTAETIFKSPASGDESIQVINGYSNLYDNTSKAGILAKVTSDNIVFIVMTSDLGNTNLETSAALGNIAILPETIYHMVLSYKEGQYLRVLLNGSVFNEYSLSGRANLVNGHKNKEGSPLYTAQSLKQYFANISRIFWCRPWYFASDPPDPSFRGGPMALYRTARDQTEMAALYDKYANPQLPQFSAWEAVLAADMPSVWFRLNDPDNAQPATSRVAPLNTANYSTTGIEYSQTGIVAGEVGAAFRGGVLACNSPLYQGDFFTFETFVTFDALPVSGVARLWDWDNLMYLQLEPTGALTLAVNNGSATVTYTTEAGLIEADTEYHIVWRHDPVINLTSTLTLNNVLEYSGVAAYYMRTDARTISIGGRASNSNPANAVMQDWLWYPYILPDASVQAHYDAWQNS